MIVRVFEEVASDVDTDDGGRAKILTIYELVPPDENCQLFVRVQSWDEACGHVEYQKLIGKRLRVTVEVLDE